MVIATVVLFLANTALSTVVTIAWARGEQRVIPQFAFFFSTLGRFLGELLAFSFSVSLFYVTYRYASVRRLPWRTALLASTFTALLFEVAKRLYGLYLAQLRVGRRAARGRQHRRGGAVRALGLLHGDRLPARRRGRRDLGAAPHAAAAARDRPGLTDPLALSSLDRYHPRGPRVYIAGASGPKGAGA